MTQEQLKSILEYDPEGGLFTWKSVRNTKRLGKPAGFVRTDGYRMIRLLGKSYFAHRLAFLYMTGKFPDGEVDHINGDRGSNRWCNLRACTPKQNRMNLKVYKNNTTQTPGVSWHTRRGKWQARIGANGKRRSLGYYDNIDDAVAARLSAQQEIFGEFARQ